MKKLFCLFALGSLLAAACNNNNTHSEAGSANTGQQKVDTSLASALTFEEKVHNFGDITEGEKVEYSFKFTNTGNSPVVIEDAISSCGCTVPEWPKSPIKPGESGFMKVIFDSHGKSGYTEKEISIKTNGSQGYILGPKIQCNIVSK
ncbi:Protein of unknown function [Chitinophaga terrae (ex Kim and Jung 2007)]|jgi:hypothetical protein|uniref:DUF1573 domain-containing protein n=1 Tax=Chitinophaga terrae (ex Kim and Jung 2007) TaxID=408074 RepID=A0A1H3X0A8_9BACT|nr:DUF1573 domain-containing protein [Chitinophaga terrae (ex Kim and Jung 2007)]MDQ0106976.1 hypothetical protein [Chitinophaga terrae (ex Kim and Jung 2007)]GEP90220.1 hypothetical protein CTE07_18650 [Chitinophaga terrae (ex Kim and Jung 2007)]SDZ92391.1 Protein of unknown function [Chitinophaga terrae (ex Kim and Jung 2007)]